MLHTTKSFTTEYSLEEADVCVVGVPFDSTATVHPLQRYGPTLIREALKHTNFYIPAIGSRLSTKFHDAGDVDVAPGSFEVTDERIRDTMHSVMETNPDTFPLILGGEHSVSLSAVRELEPETIVVLDAHTDLWEEYNGVRYSHATWLHHAKEELGCDVVLLGVRAWTEDIEGALGDVLTELPDNLEGPVYISLDMDVFDPSHAPDVGTPEPNGLTPEEVFKLLDRVFESDVVGMDVVELASDELGGRTAALAAQSIVRALSNLGFV